MEGATGSPTLGSRHTSLGDREDRGRRSSLKLLDMKKNQAAHQVSRVRMALALASSEATTQWVPASQHSEGEGFPS